MLATVRKHKLLHLFTKKVLRNSKYYTLNQPRTKLHLLGSKQNNGMLLKISESHKKLSKEYSYSEKKVKNVCMAQPGKWPSGNRITYKFSRETETALNAHIQAEMKAFYYYLSMANYFDRVDVALPGCRNYFLKMHEEEHNHALQFINYINVRGGSVILCAIEPPEDQDWKCPLFAFQTALQLEQEVSEKLELVHECAKKCNDLSATDFIVTNFIKEQMESINEIGKYVSILYGIGDYALGRYLFDQNLLKLCPRRKTLKTSKHGLCT